MKLNGSSTRFRASGAGAYFTEVDFNESGGEVDLAVANDDRAKRFVDPVSRAARITGRGFVESTSDTNFIDVMQVARVVDVTDFTGVDQGRLDFYAPWQVLNCGLKHGKMTASEDNMELIGTGGAIPSDFDPDTYGTAHLSGGSSGSSGTTGS